MEPLRIVAARQNLVRTKINVRILYKVHSACTALSKARRFFSQRECKLLYL